MSTPKSCATCPSHLNPEEASRFFGTAVNYPMCARYGHVLGLPTLSDSQNAIIQRGQAESCDTYGKKAPIEGPEIPAAVVFLPVARTMMEEEPTPEDLDTVGSCKNCLFYIKPSQLNSHTGLTGGACARRGKVILPERVVNEATHCSEKIWPTTDHERYNDASELMFHPLYEQAIEHDDSPAGRWRAERKNMTDPADWPTDAPVGLDDKAHGIKAWRRIEDPNGSGNSVLIPVFDIDFFDDTEADKVPQTGDREAPEDYVDTNDYVYSSFVEMLLLNETPALWGPPGVGKTELARHLAWLMQAPFDRISITSSTEVEHVAGMMHFIDGETTFVEGRVPRRWRKPGVVLIDEPNAGPPDVWQFFRPLTDNSKQLVLDMAGHEVPIDRHRYCFLLMAMNPTWDFRNTGLNEVADADTNRLAHIYMDYPERATEALILENACARDGWKISKGLIKKILDASEDIRRMSAEGSLPVTWGVRNNLKVVRHLRYFNAQVAYKRAVTDYLDPDVSQMVLKVVEMKGL